MIAWKVKMRDNALKYRQQKCVKKIRLTLKTWYCLREMSSECFLIIYVNIFCKLPHDDANECPLRFQIIKSINKSLKGDHGENQRCEKDLH